MKLCSAKVERTLPANSGSLEAYDFCQWGQKTLLFAHVFAHTIDSRGRERCGTDPVLRSMEIDNQANFNGIKCAPAASLATTGPKEKKSLGFFPSLCLTEEH